MAQELKNKLQKKITTSILTGALFFLSSQLIAGTLLDFVDSISVVEPLNLNTQNAYELERKDTTQNVLSTAIAGNQIDSITQKPNPESVKIPRKKRVISPQRALLLSAILPGLGQAYNGKYWKIPLFYGAGYALFYGYGYFDDRYDFLVDIEHQIATGETSYAELQTNKDFIDKAKKDSREWREKMVLYMAFVYLANIIDAMADAYFLQYDMSDDLHFSVEPDISTSNINMDMNYGFKLSLNF